MTGMNRPVSSLERLAQVALGQEVDPAGDPERRDRDQRLLGHLRGPQVRPRPRSVVSATANRTAAEVDLGVLRLGPACRARRTRRRRVSLRTRKSSSAWLRMSRDPALAGPDRPSDDEGIGVQGQRNEVRLAAEEHRLEHGGQHTRGRPGAWARARSASPGRGTTSWRPAVTSCSAPCWRPSYRARTVSSVSISSSGLSGPKVGDPRKAQRVARLVAVRADDHVERDLDDDRRLDLAVAPEALDRVGLEPRRHLGDLGVGQAAVRLADRDEPVVLRVADGERVVGQDAVALAVADLDPDDDAIDRRQRLLHLQPAEAAPAGRVDRARDP